MMGGGGVGGSRETGRIVIEGRNKRDMIRRVGDTGEY